MKNKAHFQSSQQKLKDQLTIDQLTLYLQFLQTQDIVLKVIFIPFVLSESWNNNTSNTPKLRLNEFEETNCFSFDEKEIL